MPAVEPGDKDHFHTALARPALAAAIERLVAAVGPVDADTVDRAVAQAWGFAALGSRIRDTLAAALGTLPVGARPVRRDGFYWPASVDPASWSVFRGPGPEGPRRPEHIPPEEWAAAALAVLRVALRIRTDELAQAAARALGLAAAGVRAREATEQGVALLVTRGLAHRDGDRVRLAEEM
jgi:hypothetical protein